MAILQWTPYQWGLIYDMLQSNGWRLHRFFDSDKNNQVNVSLEIYGSLDIATRYKTAFGGRTARPNGRLENRKGQFSEDLGWKLSNEELDDFLDTLWIMISKIDPCFRLSDVRQAQDIRKRIREGNSYAHGQSKSTQRR